MRHATPSPPLALLVGLALLAGAPASAQNPGSGYGSAGFGADAIDARVWLDRGKDPVVRRGDRVRLYYRTAADAYVAIFHVDTDGNVGLVHPRAPGRDHYVRGGRDYRLVFSRSPYWRVDESPGVGYFFMVASHLPMDFSGFRYVHGAGGWDLSRVGRTVYRDPYAAMDDYAATLVPGWERVTYSLGFVEYQVGGVHRYPRFLCYDCHGFRPYDTWNPYYHRCRSFRVVIYTDPIYYPVRRYGPRRVVYVRPYFSERPRYIFTERAPGAPGTPLVRRRAKPRGLEAGGAEVRRTARPAGPDAGSRGPVVRRGEDSRERPGSRGGGAVRTGGREAELRAPPPQARSRPGLSDRRDREGAERRRPTSILPGARSRSDAEAGSRSRGFSEPSIRRRGGEVRPPPVRGGGGSGRPSVRPRQGGSSRPILRPRPKASPRPSVRSRGGDARSPTLRRGGGSPRPDVRPRGDRGRRPGVRPSGKGDSRRPSVRPSGGGGKGKARPPPPRRKPPDGGG